jgi:hypothetical protein
MFFRCSSLSVGATLPASDPARQVRFMVKKALSYEQERCSCTGTREELSQRHLEGVWGRHGQLAGQVLAEVSGGLPIHFVSILKNW